MLDKFDAVNVVSTEGNPAGGSVVGNGLTITWQCGPLGRGTDRKEPNGAFVETVIAAAKQRIEWYQNVSGGKFACAENAKAIDHLNAALEWLNQRTERREKAGVEGTHAGN